MAEIVHAMVKAYGVGVPDSLVVVIPKEVRELQQIRSGQHFLVKVDDQGRIIYEPSGAPSNEKK